MTEFEVVNVVGTIDFQQPIALDPLADSLANREESNRVEYDPEELHLIHSWLFEQKVYVAFYKNGTCSVTGASSLSEFHEVSEAVSDVVQDILDFEVSPSIRVANIVTTSEIGYIPTLEAIAIGLGLEQTEYEPEQFPALIYRGEDAVFLIFADGKIVCTGLDDIDEISSAIDAITEQIEALEGL